MYKNIDGWQKGIKKMQGKLDFDAETGRIKNSGEVVGNVITIFQVGAVLGGNFYDNFVAHDMDGEDFMEDIIVDMGGLGVSYIASTTATYVVTKIGAGVGTVVGGPLGTMIGIAGGMAVGLIYSTVKDDIHYAIEDIEDWWEQCWW